VLDRLRKASPAGVILGLSGGKDSLVTLDLCLASGLRVVPFFLYVVRGLECVEAGPIRAAQRAGLDLLFRPHPLLSEYLRKGIGRPGLGRQVKVIKWGDVEDELREATGLDWFAYGHKRVDSIWRCGLLSKCGGFDERRRIAYPLHEWGQADVWSYLRRHRIPPPRRLCPISSRGDGFAMEPAILRTIRDRYPDDFARVCHAFPFAPAIAAGLDIHDRERAAAEAAPPAEVHDGASEPG